MVAAGKEPLEAIKRIIHEEAARLSIAVEKVILFGSRARGTTAQIVTGIYLLLLRVSWTGVSGGSYGGVFTRDSVHCSRALST